MRTYLHFFGSITSASTIVKNHKNSLQGAKKLIICEISIFTMAHKSFIFRESFFDL